jgi:hypothetical protein
LFAPTNQLAKLPLYYQVPFFFHTVDHINKPFQGYDNDGMDYVSSPIVEYVWGGYFGGRVEVIKTIKNLFEALLSRTL